MSACRTALTDGAVRPRLGRRQEAPRAGRRAASAGASPTPPGSGAARACGGWRPTRARRARTPAPERLAELSRAGHALVPALLDGVLPAARLERGAGQDRLRLQGRAPPRPTASPPAGASILALPHLANWDLAGAWVTTELETPVHHGRRAAQARDALRPLRRLPRGPRHGGPAAQRRRRLRHAGPAAARRAAWSAWSPTATCPPPASRWTSSARPRGCPPGRRCWPSRPARCCCR